MKNKKQSGFTLVELAIVLVIIGLIVGGVLVGQDLIKAAEIRSAVAQVEKYNTAATAFRTKYDGFPGDIVSTRAQAFQLTYGAGTDGLGDGDGVLENGANTADKQGVGGENTLFWRHLTTAQFIPDNFNTANGAVAVSLADDGTVAGYLPTLKLRDSADVHVAGIGGRNYFYIAAITSVAVTTGAPTEAAALAPSEAENIDQKVDDGLYATGIFRVYDDLGDATSETAATAAAAAAGVCIDSGPNPDAYNLDPDFANSIGCSVRWRSSF